MAPRVSKRKHFELYRQPIDLQLAIGILSVFGLLVAVYLVASCGSMVMSVAVPIESPAVSITRGPEAEIPAEDPKIKQFSSQDDFKSYIDEGKRLYGDGIFETQSLTPLAQAGKQVLSTAAAAKSAKAVPVATETVLDPTVARKYFSLRNSFDPNIADIAQIGKTSIYFSPENQYYTGAYSENENADEFPGQTRVINAFPADTISQSDTIPADGNVLLAGESLVVFLGNSFVAYNSDAAFGRQELWRDRVNDGSEIIGSKFIDGKLYLSVRSVIDDANPCPLKPVSVGDDAYLVTCGDIYHQSDAMLADSVITAFQIDTATGKIEKSLSFVVNGENASVIFSQEGIYAYWGEGGDYITFFSDFLKEKCKSLIPNYILSKAADLGRYDISLLAKEMELRSVMMNWLATLDAEEQARITGEITTRMADYMAGGYHAFERTRVAEIDKGSFKFSNSKEVDGLLPDQSFMDVANNNLRILAVAGGGVAKKMNWLVTGQVSADITDEAVNSVSVLDSDLKMIVGAERLNLKGGICAVRFGSDIAYASTCSGSQIHVINLSQDENVGLASSIEAGSTDFYIYSLPHRQLLVISKNKRTIDLTVFDNTLAIKPEKKSAYALDDYWADLESNYRSFAADDDNKLFFIPAGKGGHVFFQNNGNIEFQTSVGDMVPSRAYLKGGMLYIMSDGGIEVFGAPEWTQIGKLLFKD